MPSSAESVQALPPAVTIVTDKFPKPQALDTLSLVESGDVRKAFGKGFFFGGGAPTFVLLLD